MIRYALCCEEGHRFESWFYDSLAFDEQAGRGLVTCPTCDSCNVVKAIMAPAVVARGSRKKPVEASAEAGDAVAASRTPQSVEVALVDDRRRDMVRAFRDKVLAETRDVGPSFAAEARRIHASEDADERIRGQATLAESRDLLEDGIMVLPLPTLPDDLN